MRLLKALPVLALPALALPSALLLAGAPAAAAAETAKEVSGPPRRPGGVPTAHRQPRPQLTGGGHRSLPHAAGSLRARGPAPDAPWLTV
ncbi:hypothetical protein VM98_36975, partial [Streptomyces rubellomurinus subsp. indigoferus]